MFSMFTQGRLVSWKWLFKGALPLIALMSAIPVQAKDQTPAYRIGKETMSVGDLYKKNQGEFYDLEKQRFELIEKLAKEAYLDYHWKKLGESQKTTAETAREKFLESVTKVSASEIKENMEKFKDHPRLKELSEQEKTKQVTEFLKSVKTRDAMDKILTDAERSKQFVVLYQKPSEPVFDVPLMSTDVIKYGPKPTDTEPLGCSGNSCQITVVEYSEFQCPFCDRVLPAVRKLMQEYKGKVRWVVRDFPLSFHNRAKPAALAARCAAEQGKYWLMYDELFKNQRALADENLKTYAKNIGLNMDQYNKCIADPGPRNAIIEKNYNTGVELGVTGTPAFFINGRRVSGALPYEEFKKIFDDELSKAKSKS